MSKYAYPAVFTKEDDGITVTFPDVEGCITCGQTMAESMLMAEDALAMMLAEKIVSYQDLNEPSKPEMIHTDSNQIVNMIACDTEHYERKFNKKVVKKSVSIPKWLNDEALKKNINFSEVLKNALLEILEI